jgi:hypothetical protein
MKHEFKCDYWIFKNDGFITCDSASTIFYKRDDVYPIQILTRCNMHSLKSDNFHL